MNFLKWQSGTVVVNGGTEISQNLSKTKVLQVWIDMRVNN